MAFHEEDSVRLARIEEHMVHVKSGLQRVEDFVAPTVQETRKNSLDIAILKNDRKWMFLIVAAISGFIGHASDAVVGWFHREEVPHATIHAERPENPNSVRGL